MQTNLQSWLRRRRRCRIGLITINLNILETNLKGQQRRFYSRKLLFDVTIYLNSILALLLLLYIQASKCSFILLVFCH
ncbi:hypothetical protein AQUCO_04500160v1 [Aquilegia coerulea]|uniref:Uncharacterized protein n=1 Tax=Aquilegia coerulea TaxID=218851 RepID=A0A2G5CND9_AQUCA|nr:hypothetical protein AQUCO_04500160v1 [Aquilegia coerulea]